MENISSVSRPHSSDKQLTSMRRYMYSHCRPPCVQCFHLSDDCRLAVIHAAVIVSAAGTVKEKEKAHREYKEAIAKGHGAYLMDKEQPVSMSYRHDF